MQGVTTAIVAFIFVCIAMPSLVKNKKQYYAALVAVLFIIFVDAVAHMFPANSITAVCYVLSGFAQIVAIAMLVLATGGLTARELSGEMIEVLRRGETEKEVIIPLSDEAKQKIRANQDEAERRVKRDVAEPKVYTIDTPAPAPKPADHPGPLPMD
jgi:hypothetical protein